jgi:hypothetical protein
MCLGCFAVWQYSVSASAGVAAHAGAGAVVAGVAQLTFRRRRSDVGMPLRLRVLVHFDVGSRCNFSPQGMGNSCCLQACCLCRF